MLSRWIPVVGWAAGIASMSSDSFSGENTRGMLWPLLVVLLPWADRASLESVHAVLRKAGHLTEYAVLAALLVRALRRPGRTPASIATTALAASFAWAVLDEWHQSFVPSRTASAGDVAIDTAGAALGLTLALAAALRGSSVSAGRRSRA